MRRFLLAAALIALAPAAYARPLSADEAASLDKTLASFSKAMMSKDAEKIVSVLPPRVLNFAAAQAGMEMKTLRATMAEQTSAVLKGTKFSNMKIDSAGADAQDAVGSDGKPVVWALLGSEFDMEAQGAKQHYKTPVIALNEAGKWYVMRIEAGTEQMLEAIYPFLKGAHYPEASVAPAN